MAKAENIGYKKFQETFFNEEICHEYLFKSHWKNGFVCPICGCVEYYHISERRLSQCKGCRHQWSCTAGTVMYRNVKAFVNGTFHGLAEKHLQRYLDEFCYRFNRRFSKSHLFDKLLSAVVVSSPLTFTDFS
ncbi:MAG: hypothetical protein A2Y15_07605 [Clostridiales bacterium GWF2_36_10]|nr:MAG: hypothetical protein A2Y15_07605 [Clostridiales bacterium GWF2_36_10]HAN22070.1 hypothetical protein [Clostridiales bacterium]